MRISVTEAIRLLNDRQVVGVPTETVYGLAASLKYPEAIEQIYKLKGRPANNPLIVHVANLKEVFFFLQETICDIDLLARDFWPGPLTLILPIKDKLIPPIARAQLPTAAFRIPSHPLALQILKETGPLVMPSANLSGRPSSTQAKHVEQDFGCDFPVVDGGTCGKGLESTILVYGEGKWRIIRQGALGAEQFFSCLSYSPSIENKSENQTPLCPGQMYRHYAPKTKLKLVTSFEQIQEGVIVGFSDRPYPQGCRVLPLGPLSDPCLVAANLYSVLRQLDQENCVEAYVDSNFPRQGLFVTLFERLSKASNY